MRSRIVKEHKDSNAVPSLTAFRRQNAVARLGIRPTHSCAHRSELHGNDTALQSKTKSPVSFRNIRAFWGASCRRYTAFSEILGCRAQSLGLLSKQKRSRRPVDKPVAIESSS
jgi:hypothetical protein